MKLHHSLAGKFALLAGSIVAAAIVLTAILYRLFDSLAVTLAVSLAVSAPFIVYAVGRFMHPIRHILIALGDGVSSFRDGDFSISLNAKRKDELGTLIRQYNQVGEILRQERYNIYQREMLLDTVIQNTPWALLLVNATERIIYSNIAARRLFKRGRKLEGYALSALLESAPPEIREAVTRGREGVFSVHVNEEDEVYYLTRETFALNSQAHHLYVFKQMTRELNRQEVVIWKKVIRVISHELNNSLAPISSLAHSGQLLTDQADPARLKTVFETIEERATHLNNFIDGYARFSKLPIPQIEPVTWTEFMNSLGNFVSFSIEGKLPTDPAHFDPAQLQQVLINLIKNAHESGSPAEAITVSARQVGGGIHLEVCDGGPGMSSEDLEQSLLPFYSTKQTGSGLGLPLCREIVEAHGGRLGLTNRSGGGLMVNIWLPSRPGLVDDNHS